MITDKGLSQRALRRFRDEGVRGVGRALEWRGANLVWSLRRAIGYRLIRPPAPNPTPMEGALRWLATRESFTIVQIGAYVGDSPDDPLYDFLQAALRDHPGRRAILVEPVRDYFEALWNAYKHLPNVRLENVAITEEAGERELHRLAPGVHPADHGHPEWLARLSSLRPDHWERSVIGDAREFMQQHIAVETVRCWTLDELVERHAIDQIDLLQIDAEGYDYEILRTIDFSELRPRFINYERVHLEADEPRCRAMLMDAGYVLFDWELDTFAVALERAEPE